MISGEGKLVKEGLEKTLGTELFWPPEYHGAVQATNTGKIRDEMVENMGQLRVRWQLAVTAHRGEHDKLDPYRGSIEIDAEWSVGRPGDDEL